MKDFINNLDLVVKEFLEMNDDDFEFSLKEHENGDIANALIETGALENRDDEIFDPLKTKANCKDIGG